MPFDQFIIHVIHSIKSTPVGLQKNHLFGSDLDLALIPQPHVLVPIGESLSVHLYQVLLAQTPQLPSLHLEVEHNHRVLSGNRPVGQLQVDFKVLVFLADVGPLFVAADEEHSAGYVFLPGRTTEYSIAQLWKITHMDWFGDVPFFRFGLQLLHRLLSDDLLFPLDQLQDLPADLLPVFVVAFEVWADVGNHFGGFVLFDEAYDGEDVEDFWDEVFEIEVFLLVHKALHNLLNAALSHHIFLVY